MMKRVFLTVAAGSMALALSCNNSSDRGNSGGSGGDSSEGGGGGSSTGGTGGKGGTGGTKSGGSGGTKSGGSGGTASGGAASGGSGGAASGGAGGTAGGGAGGAATGGAAGAAISHPTWPFETSIGPFNNGVAHFGDSKAQCDHGRLTVTGPTLSDVQKKDGAMSAMYDFNIPTARTDYAALNCQTCTANGDAMTCVAKPIASSVALIAVNTALLVDANTKAGAAGGVLPAGTLITFNLYWPGATAPVSAQGYILGVGINWPTQVEAQAKNLLTDGWHELTITLETPRTLGLFWNELGVIINQIPATFVGKAYLDSVDIKLP